VTDKERLAGIRNIEVNDYHGWADGLRFEDYIWLLQQAEKVEKYEDSLRSIDTHIRATGNPVPYIIGTLKKTLPEYMDY
jgi:hypothetical protein